MSDTEIFRRMDLFWGMNDTELEQFREIATVETIPSGKILFKEGDECNKLYIVVKGMIAISTTLAGGLNKTLGMVYPGNQFGEMALIDDAPRAATAKAADNSELLSVTRDDFLDLIEKNPTFAAKALINLSRTLSQNLRNTNELLREAIDWNIKISGASSFNLNAIIENTHRILIRLTNQEEIRGLLLRVERSALGPELIVEDESGQLFVIPAGSIMYITSTPDNTTLPTNWD